jgi:hypothetical protein
MAKQIFIFERDEERKQSVAPFTGILKSISPEPVGQFPSGKYYHVASVEFINSKNEKTLVSALVNQANFEKGMEVGGSYLCQVIIKDGQKEPLITCSHLPSTGGARATFEDFGFTTPKSIAAPVNQEEVVA